MTPFFNNLVITNKLKTLCFKNPEITTRLLISQVEFSLLHLKDYRIIGQQTYIFDFYYNVYFS